MLDILKQIKNNELIKNIIFSGGAQFVNVLFVFILTPLYIKYFEDNVILGVWLTLISLIEAAANMDLGIGNGMRNKLTSAIAVGDHKKAQTIVSSCYYMVFGVISILTLVWLVVGYKINWNRYLNIEINRIDSKALTQMVLCVGGAVLIQMIFKLITSVLYALQKAAIVSWQIVIVNLSLIIYMLITMKLPLRTKVSYLAIAYAIIINLPYVITSCIVFIKQMPYLMPKRKFFSLNIASETLKLGLVFFYLTIMSMFTHNTNEILITSLFSPSLVVEYQAYNRVFSMITLVVNIIMIPVWSALTKELALKNYKWIKQAHKYMCLLSVLAFTGGVCLTFILQIVFDIWLGKGTIVVSIAYCIPFVLYLVENTIGGANATVANGCNWLKAQIILAPVSACLNIPLTLLLRDFLHGWSAIMYANVLSLLPITIGQFIYVRRKMREYV